MRGAGGGRRTWRAATLPAHGCARRAHRALQVELVLVKETTITPNSASQLKETVSGGAPGQPGGRRHAGSP